MIFADEPTGNLDSHTGGEILDFMSRAVREFGQTIVMVTHDAAAAARADEVIFLADGSIVDHMTDAHTGPPARPHEAARELTWASTCSHRCGRASGACWAAASRS